MKSSRNRREFLQIAAAGVAVPQLCNARKAAAALLPGVPPVPESSPAAGVTSQQASAAVADTTPAPISLSELSAIGKGSYKRPRLRRAGERRELNYDFHFEETAPGRNSAANEWSAYGVTGGKNAFNCMGRDLRVRYPAYDLVFPIYAGEKEISPGNLESFRLGLVGKTLPAVWGGWQHEGLDYRVSVMAVPTDEQGNAFDLYKLTIVNPGQVAMESKLVAALDGPPDMRLEGDVVRGLGKAVFLVVDRPERTWLVTRDWGLVDKRAKSYDRDGDASVYDHAIISTRIGLDGLPVVYRFKAEKGKAYTVYLAAFPVINKLLPQPKQAGDLVFKYEVEGARPQAVDWVNYSAKNSPPICLRFDHAQDQDGDGYIEVRASNAENSRLKHTRLSAIYVFASGIEVKELAAVYSGSLNKQCLRFIDVGMTPEVGTLNQDYDKSDVGLCRFHLAYGGTIGPGETKTQWLKVPHIHRRQAVSMGAIGHAFSEVLPGEAVPPLSIGQITQLRSSNPAQAEETLVKFWADFCSRMAEIETPDPILRDVYISRICTRAIHDVKISEGVWFNTCSPWFYYDFAYRDQAYVVRAYDLAGMHELAERLLKVYCMDIKDVPKGPICFGDEPLQLGMEENGLWLTRPGQYDAQGQNLWALVEHYKLSGNRTWLEKTAYPYVKRAAQWLVHSRHQHMKEVADPNDPRYGLIQPGGMEVWEIKKGMHDFYTNAWAVLGLQEAADAAAALRCDEDQKLFAKEARDLRKCLHRSFEQTFKRTGLYEGHMWFGVEKEGEGMYGFWGHTPLLWPTRSVEPHDPLLTGTLRMMERMANQWGGGLYSDSVGSCWPYITVDWAISYILRGEPEKALDFFCAYTDTAGLTLSWGEGYNNEPNSAAGDQPHFWADAQWLSLYRHLFALEDGSTLLLTPATLRRWQQPAQTVRLKKLPTHFGDLNLTVTPQPDGEQIDYRFSLIPKGDQGARRLDKVTISPRAPLGRRITAVALDGKNFDAFTSDQILVTKPVRNQEYHLRITLESS